MRKFYVTLLSAFLFACANPSSWRPFKEITFSNPSAGVVYIYYFCDSIKQMNSGGDLYIDGVKSAYVSQGAYYGKVLSKGQHTIKYKGTDTPHLSVKVDLQPGESKYIWIGIPEFIAGGSNASGVVRYEMKVMPAKFAAKEIKSCRWAKKNRLSSEDAL